MSVEGGRWGFPPDLALLVLITLVGAWLRFRNLGEPALWLDELLNYDIATDSLRLPWHAWILGFERENGPLYYASLLAGRAAADLELSMRLASAIFGTLTVPLLALVLRAQTKERYLPILSAALLMISPFHVYYSKEGRPYALLVLEAVLILGAFLRPRSHRWVVAGAAACIAAGLTAATAAPLLAATLCAAVAVWVVRRERAAAAPLIASSLAGVALLFVHYSRYEQPPSPPQPFGLEIAGRLLNVFSSTGLEWTETQWTAYLFLMAAAAGVWSLLRTDRGLLLILAVFLCSGLAATVGGLLLVDHWFSTRYVIIILPAYLVLVAAGASAASRAFGEAPRAVIAAGLCLLLTMPHLHEAMTESDWKVDWRTIISTIRSVPEPPRRVITSNTWTAVCLGFYARETGTTLDIQNANESVDAAKLLLGRERAVALVAAGWHGDESIRRWMEGGCEVWSSAIETARVYLYPDCP